MWLDIRRPWLDRKPDWLPEREAKARYVDLLVHDPDRAKRERLRAVRGYWKRRLKVLEKRLRVAEEALAEALQPPPEDDPEQPPIPPVELWRLRCACAVAWAEVQTARARLAEITRELGR